MSSSLYCVWLFVCVCVCVCVCVKAHAAVKDIFSMVKIFLFSMNVSGLYIRYAWDLHNSWRFKFLCVCYVCVCVSGKLVELQLCESVCMYVCPWRLGGSPGHGCGNAPLPHSRLVGTVVERRADGWMDGWINWMWGLWWRRGTIRLRHCQRNGGRMREEKLYLLHSYVK